MGRTGIFSVLFSALVVTAAANAHLPDRSNVIDELPLPRRPHSFLLMTS